MICAITMRITTVWEKIKAKTLRREESTQKITVVLYSNAIVYPGTVVVEPLDAPLADCAVTTPNCPDNLAVRAERRSIVDFNHVNKRDSLAFNISRVSTSCQNIKQDANQCEEQINDNGVSSQLYKVKFSFTLK